MPNALLRVLAVCIALLLAAAVFIVVRRTPDREAPIPASARHGVEATPAPQAAAPEPSVGAVIAPTAVEPPAVRRANRKVKAPAPAVAAPAAPLLKVDSDVPGASVFVDRVYLGKTPYATSEVTPGSHTLTVAAEGYESQANTIDVRGGTADVMVRFKVVRLNEALPVMHKHALGSCEGRLVATPQGLRYETSNREHAFTIPFSDLRSFEVDYLKKNLRLTRKDGKNFNFTDHNANADALFVFHEKVEKARAKLAAGVPPADR